jgi:predicted acyltransferase
MPYLQSQIARMNQRYYSLDVFRGATVALMIMVNNPGSWAHIFAPLDHAKWHGCTPTDLVFPFFLFAVGNAMAFVMPRFEKEGTGFFFKKVVKRTILIFAIGLLLNWSPFIKWDNDQLTGKPWETVRIMGVLQRIALCYLFASLAVYFLKAKGAFVFSCILLILYWLLCLFLGDANAPYSLWGWFGTKHDISIVGLPHMYKGEGVPFDPEGLMSSFAAIVQVIFGYFVGKYIQQKGKTYEMLSNLFVAGTILIVIGCFWDLAFPINKKIWTSSYTVYTTGLATITIAILIYLIEFKQMKGAWSRFFDVFGKNPLFIFAFSSLFAKLIWLIRIPDGLDKKGHMTYTDPWHGFYKYVCAKIPGDPKIGSFVFSLCVIFLFWSICYFLDKKKIYIKV